jgi:ABC-2 type transport system ATP-binding protein
MTAEDHSPAPALRVDGLAKRFGDGEDAVQAVDGVSLSVDHGEVVGVLGPNGAGKTTAIKSMLGLVLPDSGTVEICGVDVHDEAAAAYRHVDAMLEGARNVYWRLTVRENLRYFAGLGGDHPAELTERHDRLLETLGLADEADTVVNDLSRGMKQKVSLATTLSRDVDVVFLDEPTLGLDVESSIELRSELRRLAERENVTIVLCSHDMAVIEAVCDRIVILQDGQVIADDPMAELVDVLREKRFTVTTRGPLPDDLSARLRDRFDATVRPVEDGRGTRDGAEPGDETDRLAIDATGLEATSIADLLDVLRAADCRLLDVETAEPTLEDVFLRLTESGSGARSASEGTASPASGAGHDDPGQVEPRADGDGRAEAAAAETEVSADGDR